MRTLLLIFSMLLLNACKDKISQDIFEDVFTGGSEAFKAVIDQKDKYEVQILFTPIQTGPHGREIENHFFNYKPNKYFYPASSVKMPVAFLALQKLYELRALGVDIDRNTTMHIDSIRPPQAGVVGDSTHANNRATIGHYIDKLFVVSDNDAYNRLYEFCGPDYINSELRKKNIFTNSRIVHRVGVGGFSYEENKHSPPIHFIEEEGDTLHTQHQMYATGDHLTAVDSTQKGVAYVDSEGRTIEEPFDFSKKNFINIQDLQKSLQAMIFPDLSEEVVGYDVSKDDREFVMSSMATLPQDHEYLKNNLDEYYDGYVKFFLFGDSKDAIPDHIAIRNKVGFAYGYLTDCAYIQDTKEGIEYFLTATIHVNENKTYNDGVYEYDDVGIPFLAELGRLVHDYMIKNKG